VIAVKGETRSGIGIRSGMVLTSLGKSHTIERQFSAAID
jgi:hypothetical protein